MFFFEPVLFIANIVPDDLGMAARRTWLGDMICLTESFPFRKGRMKV